MRGWVGGVRERRAMARGEEVEWLAHCGGRTCAQQPPQAEHQRRGKDCGGWGRLEDSRHMQCRIKDWKVRAGWRHTKFRLKNGCFGGCDRSREAQPQWQEELPWLRLHRGLSKRGRARAGSDWGCSCPCPA